MMNTNLAYYVIMQGARELCQYVLLCLYVLLWQTLLDMVQVVCG